MKMKCNSAFLVKSGSFILDIQECVSSWRSIHDSPSDYSSGDYRLEFDGAIPRYVLIKDQKGRIVSEWSRSLYFYLKPFKTWLNELFSKEQCDTIISAINEKAQDVGNTPFKETSILAIGLFAIGLMIFLICFVPIALFALAIASFMGLFYSFEKKRSFHLESPQIWEDSIKLLPSEEETQLSQPTKKIKKLEEAIK